MDPPGPWPNMYTNILEANLFAFAYRLFHRDFSPIKGAYVYVYILIHISFVCCLKQLLYQHVQYRLRISTH